MIWSPYPSQATFLASPVHQTLLAGTKGGGKTEALLMKFLIHVGKGYGSYWRGMIFRREVKQLDDIIAKSHRIIARRFPLAKYNTTRKEWTFSTGEVLRFTHVKTMADYEKYHGHEIPFEGYEELTTWPDSGCYDYLRTLCRSSFDTSMPRIICATTNPLGIGHAWVKQRFIDPAPYGQIIVDEHGQRVTIFSMIFENAALMKNDRAYVDSITKNPDPVIRRSWGAGEWGVVAGAAFSTSFEEETHVLKDFMLPSRTSYDRSFDWGASRPFAVLYFAELLDGILVVDREEKRVPKGSIVVLDEIYGNNPDKTNTGLRLTPTQVAQVIKQKEKSFPFKVNAGPADASIFGKDRGNNTDSIYDLIAKEGVTFTKSYKAHNSRAQGFQKLKDMLYATINDSKTLPHLYISDKCINLIRTLKTIPYDDSGEDVSTEAEDHLYDALRYRCYMGKKPTISKIKVSGF